MNKDILKKLIKEEIKSLLKEGEGEQQNYMFFQNLKTIHHAVGELLQMDPAQVDQMLSNGHGWALDHIATSADDVEEVYHFFEGLNNTGNQLSEGTHPWYTSAEGYYKGTNAPIHPTGPRHTGNVSQYLKPNVTVYNDKGDRKIIKSLTDSHIQFTDGTEDYFMNWFVTKPIN